MCSSDLTPAAFYGYDASGNRQVVGGTWARTGLPPALEAATYNAANRQVTFGAQTLTYDLNGNACARQPVRRSPRSSESDLEVDASGA